MPPLVALSQERVEDSSDDEPSSSEATQTLKETINGISQKSTNGLNHDDTSSSAESDVSSPSSTSSTSSSGSSSKRKSNDLTSKTFERPTKRIRAEYANVKRIETMTYAPPSGYSAVTFDQPSSVSSLPLNEIDGKQIWHITAPSTIPLSKLESLNASDFLENKSIIEYKGASYMVTRASTENATLLLPGSNGDYSSASAKVTRTFQVLESPKQPVATQADGNDHQNDPATNLSSFFAMQTGEKKLPREQPGNLRARYVPFGVSTSKRSDPTLNADSQIGDLIMADVAVDLDRDIVIETPKSTRKSKAKKAISDEINGVMIPSASKTSSQGPSEGSPTRDGTQGKRKKDKSKEKSG